jgi:hypothetical protein
MRKPKLHRFPFHEIDPLGVPVRVKIVKHVDALEDKLGTYDKNKLEIIIADGPIDRVQKTLIHEIVHHWEMQQGEPWDDEDLVSQIELGVYDLIKNRPKLMRFLLRKRWPGRKVD